MRTSNTLPAMRDLFDLLLDDHDRLREIMTRIDEAFTAEEREEILIELHDALSLHIGPEEDVVYASLAEHGVLPDSLDRAESEHKDMRTLLGYLATLDPGTRRWEGALDELRDLIADHLDREESELFEALRTAASGGELSQLADAFLGAKRQLHRERQSAA